MAGNPEVYEDEEYVELVERELQLSLQRLML
jgi:hypothetical protein